MSTRVYLTPSTPDKPGELVAVQHNAAPPQFMAPVSPWAMNEQQLGELRTRVQEAETALRLAQSRGASWSERTRLEQALTSAQRELDIAHYEQRLERRRQQTGGDDVVARQSAGTREGAAVGTTHQAVNWSQMPMAQQSDLIQAAIAELRRAGAV